MHPEYGKQIGQAFAAVYQLHKDVSRLLSDTVPRLGAGRVNEKSVIKETSWLLNRPNQWMPYSVCLTSTGGDLPANVVESLMVFFWRPPPNPPQEPHLVVARLAYKAGENGRIDPRYWDTCDCCFKWTDLFPVGVVNHYSPSDSRIETATLTAVPLFSISSVDDVLTHMQKVRDRAAAG
jgi:hypothetical protein